MQSSSRTQEFASNTLSFADNLTHLTRFAFGSKFQFLNSDTCSPLLHTHLYFNTIRDRKTKAVCSLSLGSKCTSSVRRFVNEFNRAIRFHCDRIPIGFGSARVNSSDANGLSDDGLGVLEDEGLSLNGIGSKSPKKVLILMSDTGGGHRASAEAIKAAFNEAFGDEYQVFVTDLWTDHTPWPFNQLPRSYNFLVKHGNLWRMTYYASSPRVVHQSNFAATSAFIARCDCFRLNDE